MAQNVDNIDEEDIRHAQRAARIEQMRREKKLQEQRRRLIKKLLPPVAGVISIIIIVVVVVTAINRNSDENDLQQQVQIEESGKQTGGTALAQNESSENQTGGTALAQNESSEKQTGGTAVTGQGTSEKSVGMQEEGISDGEKKPPIYNFETTSDSVTIYSEEVISTHAILINESTDTIVASKGAKERISPASMTKVLTVLVAAEHISEADLDDTFTMTSEITDYAYVNDCSCVGFLPDEKVTVRDLFYGTVLPSGGDAAVGLATYVAGSHEAFVDMMNEKLEELGISDSAHFTNCIGLYDENHYCTVYDMAIIMKAAMQNELCREFLSKHTYTTATTEEHPEGIEISNWFLRRIEDKDTGGEVLCAKTGYVVESQNCAVSYGTFAGGVPYICVTAGSTSSWRCIYDHVEIYNQYVK